MSDLIPKHGVTVRAHIDQLMRSVEQDAVVAFTRIREPRRLTKASREDLWRVLAGLVGAVETIRLWLDAGAPE